MSVRWLCRKLRQVGEGTLGRHGTKLDLVGGAQHALVPSSCGAQCGCASAVCELFRIDLSSLFGDGLSVPQVRSLDVGSWMAEEAHGHSHAQHHADIETYAVVRTQPIRAVALTLLLETLAEHCGADSLRLKGIVNIGRAPISRP